MPTAPHQGKPFAMFSISLDVRLGEATKGDVRALAGSSETISLATDPAEVLSS